MTVDEFMHKLSALDQDTKIFEVSYNLETGTLELKEPKIIEHMDKDEPVFYEIK